MICINGAANTLHTLVHIWAETSLSVLVYCYLQTILHKKVKEKNTFRNCARAPEPYTVCTSFYNDKIPCVRVYLIFNHLLSMLIVQDAPKIAFHRKAARLRVKVILRYILMMKITRSLETPDYLEISDSTISLIFVVETWLV